MDLSTNLIHQAKGFEGTISRIDGDQQLIRKLMSLGLRKGQTISILHQRRNGVVVFSNGNRVALGANIARQVYVEAASDSAKGA